MDDRRRDYLKTPHHLVVYRLPLFAVYLFLIGAGIERLARRGEPVAVEYSRGVAGTL